jgi:hypothetical protein
MSFRVDNEFAHLLCLLTAFSLCVREALLTGQQQHPPPQQQPPLQCPSMMAFVTFCQEQQQRRVAGVREMVDWY